MVGLGDGAVVVAGPLGRVDDVVVVGAGVVVEEEGTDDVVDVEGALASASAGGAPDIVSKHSPVRVAIRDSRRDNTITTSERSSTTQPNRPWM
jgi:hypothetical protein